MTFPRKGSLLRVMARPFALLSTLAFVLILVLIGCVLSRQSLMAARERLRAAAADIVDEMDDCVGDQLAFIGHTICETYGSPERMKSVDMEALMAEHGLDELNAIDGRGFIVASSIPSIVGDDQWKKLNPAKFNAALLREGRTVFVQAFRESADEPGTYYKYVGVVFPPPARGYLQLGFKRARLQDSFDYSLEGTVANWHLGESGFYIIAKTKNDVILSCGRNELVGKTLGNVGFDIFEAFNKVNVERREPTSQEFLGFETVNFFTSDINGERCLCTSGVVDNFHRYVAAIPFAEIFRPVRRVVLVTGIVLFIALVMVLGFMVRISDKNQALERFIAKDKRQREKDLTLAKTIQMSALPLVFPDTPRYRLFARMDTAREVGGDFYDFFTLGDGRVVFLVADVSGKGIPAALFMMRAKALIRAAVTRGADDLAAAVTEANDALAEANEAEMFVTAWIGVLNPATGAVAYVNAGHNAPLVKRTDGSVEWLRARGGLVLAAMGGVKYRLQTCVLAPGDSLFLYTDGVTEAMNADGAQYGEERLANALAASGPNFVETVRQDVARHAGDTEQSDDITTLALDFKPIS